MTALEQSLATPFAEHREKFVDQWYRACSRMKKLDGVSSDQGTFYGRVETCCWRTRIRLIRRADSICEYSVGRRKGDEDLGGYHLVWTRDLVNSALALLACDDRSTPLRALVYLACSQQSDPPSDCWLQARYTGSQRRGPIITGE